MALHLQSLGQEFEVVVGVDGTPESHDFFCAAGVKHVEFFDDDDREKEDAFLNEWRPHVALIDMLEIESSYVEVFSQINCRTVLYDDLLENYSFGDVLVCPQILDKAPKERHKGSVCQGPDYFLVPQGVMKIANAPADTPVRANNFFVNLGGTLPRDNFDHLVKVLRLLPENQFHVTVLSGYSHDFDIQEAWSEMPENVRLVPGTDKIEEVIASADIALSASGLMKFELAAAGIPMVMVAVVEHQINVGKSFCELTGVGQFAGDFIGTDPSQIAQQIVALANDQAVRKRMTKLGRELVDGKAEARFTAVLKSLVH
ncbi:MAG: glycosyltransferase [Magnetovibrio sp.]|nr:glycosyltransferase [Magnetovibrio sp.]